MRLCIDLAALRGAGRQGAVGAIEPAPAWSEDGRVAALCTLDPAAPRSRRSRLRHAHCAALARGLANARRGRGPISTVSRRPAS